MDDYLNRLREVLAEIDALDSSANDDNEDGMREWWNAEYTIGFNGKTVTIPQSADAYDIIWKALRALIRAEEDGLNPNDIDI